MTQCASRNQVIPPYTCKKVCNRRLSCGHNCSEVCKHDSCSCKVIRKKQCQSCKDPHLVNVSCGTGFVSCKNNRAKVNAKNQKDSGKNKNEKDNFLKNREIENDNSIPQL